MGLCKFNGAIENNDHIFRYCSRANMVCNSNLANVLIDNNANVDFKTWLDGNVRSAQVGEMSICANISFISTLWSL